MASISRGTLRRQKVRHNIKKYFVMYKMHNFIETRQSEVVYVWYKWYNVSYVVEVWSKCSKRGLGVVLSVVIISVL